MASAASRTVPNLSSAEVIVPMGVSLYNDLVRNSTTLLHRQRPINLHGVPAMEVGAKLRELRLRTGLTVRALAGALGHESPNGYTHWEKSGKKPLPLEVARKLASIMAQHGVKPAEVMELAGLSQKEIAREAGAIPISISMPGSEAIYLSIQLPNEDSLTRAFEGLIAPYDATTSKDVFARRLAQLLPDVLRQASDHPRSDPDVRPKARPRIAAAPPQSKAKRRSPQA